MKCTTYELKQLQYARVYRVTERTVRRWMKAGAPLDQPRDNLAWLYINRRELPAVLSTVPHAEIQLAYDAECQPGSEALAVRREMVIRLTGINAMCAQLANFAQYHRPENWEEIARLAPLAGETYDRIMGLIGVPDEDWENDWPERPDLKRHLWQNPKTGNWTAFYEDD